MATRTPRKNFRRGTQMPFQGKQNEQQRAQHGGTRRSTRGNKGGGQQDVRARTDEKAGQRRRRNQLENGNRKEEEEERQEIQDGERPRSIAGDRPNRVQRRNDYSNASEIMKLTGEIEDTYNNSSADKYDANNADIVVQKVDEWLKHRSDSLSSIEFDSEIKAVEDYEFSRLDNEENYSTGAHELNQKTTARMSDLLFRCGGGNAAGSGGITKTAPTGGATSFHSKIPHQNPACCLSENANGATIYGINDDRIIMAANVVDGALSAANKVDPHIPALTNEELLRCHREVEFDSDKSMMLMTPQELERMPESGIEFEESVGPKEFEALCKEEVMDQDDESELAVPEMHGSEEAEVSDKCAVLQDAAILSAVAAGVSSTLATISISTDNDTNTTSIIINTKLGQREFKINTANLMQAAATLQPITLADLVDQRGTSVLAAEPQIAPNITAGEHPEEACQDMSVDDVESEEPLPPVNLVKSPIKGCRREEKSPGGVVCTHTGRCKKIWTCPEPSCGKIYTKQCKLKVHMMMHSGVRPYKCEVEGCDWAFTTLYKLRRHLETHCGAKDFTCDIDGCNRSFTTIYNLNSHKKLHALPNRVRCPIDSCDEHFPTRRKMELHMKEHSEIDAPYKCTIESCGKTYYTANSMASHLRVHQKANFQCTFEGCNKVFDKLSRYKVHMWHHTGERPYVCSFEGCSWAFSSASKLKRHMRKHTGERKYPCKEPGCNKSFMRLEHLQGHLVTHRGDKPFVCPHETCDARFTAKSSLYVHLKKHGNSSMEKVVYPCPIEDCDKKYNCKSSLRIHMLRYHTPVFADAGQLDFVALLSSEGLQEVTAADNYEQIMDQQNAISVTVQNETMEATLLGAQELLQSHGIEVPDQCALAAHASNILPQQVEVATMIISELPADGGQSLSSQHAETTTTGPLLSTSQSELETLSTLCVLQENNSGSARTDFCSNHTLMDRARKRRQLELGNDPNLETNVEPDIQTQDKTFAALAANQLTSNDVILTSTAVSFHNSTATGIGFIQNQLLSDDPPPPHSDVYHEDGLLTSMASKLAVPISLLTEQSVTDASGQADFGNSQSTAGEFTGTTINLQDLE